MIVYDTLTLIALCNGGKGWFQQSQPNGHFNVHVICSRKMWTIFYIGMEVGHLTEHYDHVREGTTCFVCGGNTDMPDQLVLE